MIVGHQKILNYLSQSAESNRLSHFYLFYGPQSVGKLTAAKWLAKLLSCDKLSLLYRCKIEQHRKVSYEEPCFICQNCRAIETEIHADVLFVRRQDKASDIKIDQIRELILWLSSTTFNNRYKIAIVDQAEFLNQEAGSAFLKTLEEPARNVIIILVASRINYLPATIISRAISLKFNLVSDREIIEFLIKEKQYSQTEAKIIAGLAGGRPGRAILLAQSDLAKIKQSNFSLLNLLKAHTVLKFKTAEKLAKDLDNCKKVIDNYLRFFRDLLLIKLNLSENIIHKHLISELTIIAQPETLNSLRQKINYLEKFKEDLRRNVNLRLGMENLLLRL